MAIKYVCPEPECDGARFHDDLSWQMHCEDHLWRELYGEASEGGHVHDQHPA